MSVVFRVSAYRQDGSIFQDWIETESQAEAVAALLRRGLTPFEVLESGARQTAATPGLNHIAAKDLLEFSRSLGALIDGGLPLDEALVLVARDIGNSRARGLAKEVRTHVVAGYSLAEALKRSKRPPAPFVTGLVQAGEGAGSLAPVFTRLVDYLEKETRLRDSIRSALVYPSILAITAIAAILIILLVVAPTLKPVLLAGGQSVPEGAARLVAVSDFLVDWGVGLAMGGLSALLILKVWARSYAGKRLLGRLVYRMPLVGSTLREIEATRFLSSLSALLESGMPLVPAMNIAAAGIGTLCVKEGLQKAADLVRQGSSLSGALEVTGVFPPLAAHMASVAERSGNAPVQLARAARIFELSAQRRMERVMSLVPSVMTLCLGAVIGFVVLTLLSAVMGINDLAI